MMTRDELQARLVQSGGETGRWLRGDEGARAGQDHAGEGVPAAVLIGMVERPGGPSIVLTERTGHLRDHAGQISFPGGRVEPGDQTLVETALREAREEIGLDPERIEILGALAPYVTITGFRIHPVVGWMERPMHFQPDPTEVADVFEVPLAFVLDPANHRRQSYRRGRLTRGYYVLPYEGRFIWGATAGILVNLSALLRS
jgi:8-oxo-dGTP pyrophosphatase MutT (NUDIX family)